MQAIDPDYYKNLQLILEHNLEDIGLELNFSIEDFSFGCHMTYAIKEACRKKSRMETIRIKIDVFTPTLTK
jgi:hypothetical protein